MAKFAWPSLVDHSSGWSVSCRDGISAVGGSGEAGTSEFGENCRRCNDIIDGLVDNGGEGRPKGGWPVIGVWTSDGDSATLGDWRGDWKGISTALWGLSTIIGGSKGVVASLSESSRLSSRGRVDPLWKLD